MKPILILILFVAAIAGSTWSSSQGQSPSPVAPAKAELPLGKKCTVSVDPQASRATLPAIDNQRSGFEADGTARGELILLSDDWCVLKDGKAENWIPADKVLMIRAEE